MRNIIYYSGIIIMLGALTLMLYSGMELYEMHKAGTITFALLDPGYWLQVPNDYLSGFTPQGKLTGMFAGSIIILLIGKHLQNLSTRMD